MTDISKEQERVRNALLQKTATGKVAADIVKFVVEFIYNHLKKEFNVDSDGKQIITRCKVSYTFINICTVT